MITSVDQRWRDGRANYRSDPFDPFGFEVEVVAKDGSATKPETPKGFVLAHHYATSYPSARFRFALHAPGGALMGVAVFSHPTNNAVLDPLPGVGKERVELGRLVLLDDKRVGRNAESWFIARCFEHLHDVGMVGVISFSDDVPRTNLAGERTFKGHVGIIYQASNATYVGRATKRTLRLLPDGTVLNDRAIQKVRKRERGWEYAARQMVAAGAAMGAVIPMLTPGEDSLAWLHEQLPRCTRKLRHKGNHTYLFGLDRAAKRDIAARVRRKELPQLRYPKFEGGA